MSRRRPRVLMVALVLSSVLASVVTYQTMNARSFQAFGVLIDRVDTDSRVVAVTFDDGPGPESRELIQLLADKQVRATFFVVGRELQQRPEAGRALVAAGHELGNHTFDHRRMVFLSATTIASQIERADAEIRTAGHTGPINVRPPNGKKLLGLPHYLARRHRVTIMWDIAPDSGRHRSPDALVRAVMEQVRPGSIVLLHPWYASGAETRNALPALIDALQAEHYQLVTVQHLVALDR